MADIKSRMTRHLHSAKQWLTRAEESFDNDSNIRGELDLFLAQAELQHARETSRSGQWRYKYPLIGHALSFTLAATVVAVGIGAYWLTVVDHKAAAPVQPAVEQAQATTIPNIAVSVETSVSPAVAEPTPQPPAVTQPVSSSQVSVAVGRQQLPLEQPRHTEKENILPPEELKKIVQVAGRSLRGQ